MPFFASPRRRTVRKSEAMFDLGRVLNDGTYEIKLVGGSKIDAALPDAAANGSLHCVRFTDYVVESAGGVLTESTSRSFRSLDVLSISHIESGWTVVCPAVPLTVGSSDAHVVVGEVLDDADGVIAWFELVCDAVGSHTRPLRMAPVDASSALHDEKLRVTSASVDLEISIQGPTPPKGRAGRTRKASAGTTNPAVAAAPPSVDDTSQVSDPAHVAVDAPAQETSSTSRRGRTQTGHKAAPKASKPAPSAPSSSQAKLHDAGEDEESIVVVETAAPQRNKAGARRRRSGNRPQLVARINNLRNDALNITTRRYFIKWAQRSPSYRPDPSSAAAKEETFMDLDELHEHENEQPHDEEPADDVHAKYMDMVMQQQAAEKAAKELAAAKMEEARRREEEEREKADLEAKYFEMLMAQQEAERQTKLRVALGKVRDEESQERSDIHDMWLSEFKRIVTAERAARKAALVKSEATGRTELENLFFKLLQPYEKAEAASRQAAVEAERIRKTFKPPEDGATVVGVDSIVGIPLNVRWTRLRFFVADEVDGSTGHPVSPPLTAIELFATVESTSCQDLNSKCSEPTFTSSPGSQIQPHTGPTTAVVVLVDCALKEDWGAGWFTFAHAVLRVNDISHPEPGHFTEVLRLGDPSSAMHMNSEEAARLRLGLAANAQDGDVVPGAYVCWRKNRLSASCTGEQVDVFDPLPLSDFELEARESRRSMDLAAITCGSLLPTASVAPHELEEVIFSPATYRADAPEEALSYLSPFEGPSELFVNVESLLGAPIVPKGVLKVGIEIVTAPPPEAEWGEEQPTRTGFTTQHNFDSPIYLPRYVPDPVVFARFHKDRRAYLVIRLFSLSTLKHHEVQQVGWTVVRVFLHDRFLRQGRFMSPVFEGAVPLPLLQALRSAKGLEAVLHSALLSGKVLLAEPKMLVTFSMGYLERSDAILAMTGPFSSMTALYIRPLGAEKIAKLEAPPPGGGAVTKPLSAMFGNSIEKSLKVQESTNEILQAYILQNVPRIIVQRRASTFAEENSASPHRENRLISFFSFQPDPNHRESVAAPEEDGTELSAGAAMRIQKWARYLGARRERRSRVRAIECYLAQRDADEAVFAHSPSDVDESVPADEKVDEADADVIPENMFEPAPFEQQEDPADESARQPVSATPADTTANSNAMESAQEAPAERATFTPQSVATEPTNVANDDASSTPSSLTKRLTYSDAKEPQPALERVDTLGNTNANLGDPTANLTDYEAEDGYFLRIESLVGADPNLQYRIVVEPPPPAKPYLTMAPDPASDGGSPQFADLPVVHVGLQHNEIASALFHVIAFVPELNEVRQVGWTAARLFSDNGYGRKGRFQTPVFAGSPPADLVWQLTRDSLRVVIKGWLADKRRGSLTAGALLKKSKTEMDTADCIDYISPRCLLTFSQGSPGDMQELCSAQVPPPASVILVVPKRQKEFPIGAGEGMCGSTIAQLSSEEKGRDGYDDDDKRISGQFEKFVQENWLKNYA